ncbi:MAG: AAA family ATPase [Bacteroidetes bacterium]|nr:AAA family ATPase [Bacteroidota bacterium]
MMQTARLSSNAFLNNYQTRINYYLDTEFHTPFRIANSNVVQPQGQNTVNRAEYTLTIDGFAISTEQNQPRSAKDVLSEGDKTTIALAFFLAKLDVENIKNQKVIIFDDPLSSFDNGRRRTTVKLLARLARDAKQLVVLSHDSKFLFDLHRMVRTVEKKGLEIVYDEIASTSKIQFFEIDKILRMTTLFALIK